MAGGDPQEQINLNDTKTFFYGVYMGCFLRTIEFKKLTRDVVTFGVIWMLSLVFILVYLTVIANR